MRKTKIEWCDATWNPITGCMHGCRYCYARDMAKRFSGDVRENLQNAEEYLNGMYILREPFYDIAGKHIAYPYGFAPTFHRYRLDEPGKLNGRTIFVGSMCDLFGEWVPDEWIVKVFDVCREASQHNYLFLTKNPDTYTRLWCSCVLPTDGNFWYGTSVTQDTDWGRLTDFAVGYNGFISFEPLLEDLSFPRSLNWDRIRWFIIGAETGNHSGKVAVKREWVETITRFADERMIPVFMKDSLLTIVGEENMRREFPEGLRIERPSVPMRGTCMSCGKAMLKKHMITINGKKGRGGKSLTIGQMCPDCIKTFCMGAGFEIPEEWRTLDGRPEKRRLD